MRDQVRVGDTVEIPWGFSTIRGVVESIAGPSPSRHALVKVIIKGPTNEALDEELINLPVADLKIVSRSA